MKIIVAGDYIVNFHEEAFAKTFTKLGHEVYRFNFTNYFTNKINLLFVRLLNTIWLKFQFKLKTGPDVYKLNKDLLKLTNKVKPDLIFIYRGILIFPKTVERISKISKIFGYNNDDPFSLQYPSYMWRHYIKSLPFYDHVFYYRIKNFYDYQKINIYKCTLLRSYYIKEQNFPIENKSKKYITDVLFIGHFENDGRDQIILELAKSNQFSFKLYGPEWHRSKLYSEIKSYLGDIKPIIEKYNEVINSTKIALVFLSKINNDTYTRRCFEIPATKTFMLSEYSIDMANMFAEGIEADYFKNKKELFEKIIFYLNNPIITEKIAEQGYNRLITDGHEVKNRIDKVIEVYNHLKE